MCCNFRKGEEMVQRIRMITIMEKREGKKMTTTEGGGILLERVNTSRGGIQEIWRTDCGGMNLTKDLQKDHRGLIYFPVP